VIKNSMSGGRTILFRIRPAHAAAVAFALVIALSIVIGASASEPSPAAPPPPIKISVTVDDGIATVHWIPAIDDTGITQYMVEWVHGIKTGKSESIKKDKTSVQISGLEVKENGEYTFYLRSSNGHTLSSDLSYTLLMPLLDWPTNVEVVIEDSFAHVTWEPPADDGRINKFKVTAYEIAGNDIPHSDFTETREVDAGVNKLSLSELKSGTRYGVAVVAIDQAKVEVSKVSVMHRFVMPQIDRGPPAEPAPKPAPTQSPPPNPKPTPKDSTLLAAPTIIDAQLDDGTVTVKWIGPVDDNFGTILGYMINAKPQPTMNDPEPAAKEKYVAGRSTTETTLSNMNFSVYDITLVAMDADHSVVSKISVPKSVSAAKSTGGNIWKWAGLAAVIAIVLGGGLLVLIWIKNRKQENEWPVQGDKPFSTPPKSRASDTNGQRFGLPRELIRDLETAAKEAGDAYDSLESRSSENEKLRSTRADLEKERDQIQTEIDSVGPQLSILKKESNDLETQKKQMASTLDSLAIQIGEHRQMLELKEFADKLNPTLAGLFDSALKDDTIAKQVAETVLRDGALMVAIDLEMLGGDFGTADKLVIWDFKVDERGGNQKMVIAFPNSRSPADLRAGIGELLTRFFSQLTQNTWFGLGLLNGDEEARWSDAHNRLRQLNINQEEGSAGLGFLLMALMRKFRHSTNQLAFVMNAGEIPTEEQNESIRRAMVTMISLVEIFLNDNFLSRYVPILRARNLANSINQNITEQSIHRMIDENVDHMVIRDLWNAPRVDQGFKVVEADRRLRNLDRTIGASERYLWESLVSPIIAAGGNASSATVGVQLAFVPLANVIGQYLEDNHALFGS